MIQVVKNSCINWMHFKIIVFKIDSKWDVNLFFHTCLAKLDDCKVFIK